MQRSLLMLVFILILTMMVETATILMQHSNRCNYINYLKISIIAVGGIATMRVFEANAIQFGMDQLLEASSAQLISFVHWYFWAIHLRQQSLFLTALIGTLTLSTANFDYLTEWDTILLIKSVGIIIILL